VTAEWIAEQDPARDRVELELVGLDDAVREARMFVRLNAERCGLPEDDVDRAVQLASELVSMGVATDPAPRRIAIAETASGAVLSVRREPAGLSARHQPTGGEATAADADEPGRGEDQRLRLVAELADGWGREDGAAPVVWARVDRSRS
jgi:hypothetical protein